MADTKYLQKRGNCWYVRVPRPPDSWGMSGEFVSTLRTPDLKTAQRLRDKYLMPLLAETAAVDMVAAIARAAATGQEAIARRLADLPNQLSGLGSRLTLRKAGKLFLDYLDSSGSYAPGTLAEYRSAIDTACRLLGPDTNVADLGRREAAALRDELLRLPVGWQRSKQPISAAGKGQRTVSAARVDTILMYLRRLWHWLIKDGRVFRKDNPFDDVKVARVAANHKRSPTREEADALMALPRPEALDGHAWRMMPLLARYTGCRAGELAQLEAKDVVTEQGIRCLRVTARGEGKRLKTASSERLVPVAEKLAPHLDDLLLRRKQGRLLDAGRYEAADGTVKHAHRFLKHYNRRAKQVALDLSFHCWRVYANDAMATAGVDIGDRERLLGHVSSRTQAAYTPENLKRLKAAVDSIP
ncbi:MAG: tyrosine-type recombinase/integrase [Candidatus Brocadiia bacterium]|jgi:integrase|nr:tyrosine-type recombinase/integrase [Candidatus Brocadiia bacterium]